MIPRRFFWLFDALVITVAFAGAHLLAPLVQVELAPAGSLRPLVDAIGVAPPYSFGDFPPLSESLWIYVLMLGTVIIWMEVLGAYRPIMHQSRTRILGNAILAPLFGVGCISLMIFTTRSLRWSRLFILLFWVLCVGGLWLFRVALHTYRYHRMRAGYHAKHVALVGAPRAVRWMEAYFGSHVAPVDYQVWGHLDVEGPPTDLRCPEAVGTGRRLGTVSQLGDLLVHQPIHEVIAVVGTQQSDWLRRVVEQCDYFRVTLRIVPETLLFGSLRDLELMYHGDVLHLPQVVLRPPELDSDALFIKRLFDIVASGALLLLLSPLFLLIALAIKLTTPRLPVFYPWRVVGYKGEQFTGYKFTTMDADADEQRDQLLSRNEMTGPVFKIKDDPRVTSTGRFLRKYSLNELPQLWSVLKGDMSLVGPRPAFPHELERYDLWHKRKLCVKPGITCLWQVRGRNRINDFDEWVRMDLEYIDHWSLWLDLKILARTAWAVAAGTGS